MYLHLGNEISARYDDIIGIFDLDTSTVTRPTNTFLTKMQKEDRVVNVSMEHLPKSFVIAGKPARSMRRGRKAAQEAKRDVTVYISPLASSTLKKRADKVEFED